MENEYNYEDTMNHNSGVLLPHLVGDNYENTVDQNVTDNDNMNANC